MGSKRKKIVEWKDTRTQAFFPEYKYSLSIRNRYVFFWALGKNYRKMMNFAANFTEPSCICAVYVFGDIGKTETFKAYAEEKKLLALHLPGIQAAIDTELSFYKWLGKLKSCGLRDGENPSVIWVDDRERHIRAQENGVDGLSNSIDEYNEKCRLWKTEHPAALAAIENAFADCYHLYGLLDGKLDGSLGGHSAALEKAAVRLYPFGIEADKPKEYAYKTASARKLANSALTGGGADSLGINLANSLGQLSLFDITTMGASEAINTLQVWCDGEMERYGCFSLNEAWSILERPPFGAYMCNWYMWIFAYVLRKYADGSYFAGDHIGYTCRIPEGGDGLINALVYATEKGIKRKGDTAIFTQNAEQDEFMRLIWRLFDIDKPWHETTSSAIGQARSWITDNVHYATLAMVDKRLLEILRYRECFCWYSKGYEKEFLPWIRDNFDSLYAAIRNVDNTLYKWIKSKYGKLRADLFFKFHYVKGGAIGWLHSEEMVMEAVERYMKIENVCRECGRPLVFQGLRDIGDDESEKGRGHTKAHYEYFEGEEYRFSEKEIIGLNKKLLGRYQNEYFCIPCLCEICESDAARLYEMMEGFKEQGCALF